MSTNTQTHEEIILNKAKDAVAKDLDRTTFIDDAERVLRTNGDLDTIFNELQNILFSGAITDTEVLKAKVYSKKI